MLHFSGPSRKTADKNTLSGSEVVHPVLTIMPEDSLEHLSKLVDTTLLQSYWNFLKSGKQRIKHVAHHLFCPRISSASDPYGRCQPGPAQQWCTQHKDRWFECQVRNPATKQHTCMLREFGENNEFFYFWFSFKSVMGNVLWSDFLGSSINTFFKLMHPKGHGLNWWNLIHQDTNVTRIQNSKKLRTKQKRSDLLACFPSVIPMLFFKLSLSFSNVLRLSHGSGNLSHLSFHQPWGSVTGHCPGILCTASWQVCLALQMSISWQPWSSTSETPTPPCFPAQCLGRPEPCSTPTELPVSQWISFKIHVFVGN